MSDSESPPPKPPRQANRPDKFFDPVAHFLVQSATHLHGVGNIGEELARRGNGATISVNKTLVKGETIYALRVAGLSKAEAAALCERVEGRDCFLAK